MEALLSSAESRHIRSSSIAKAEEFIRSRFNEASLQVEDQPFRFHNTTCINVIATLQGRSKDFIVVGAHYDSLPEVGKAPGADDNASGTTSLLEIAKLLALQPKPLLTIVFVAFSAEEVGLKGSEFFVKSAWFQDKIDHFKGAIVMDQIGANMGYPGQIFETTEQHGVSELEVEIELSALSEARPPTDEALVDYHGWGSDHVSFLKRGLPAVLLISAANRKVASAFGHTSNDSIDKVNFTYAASECGLAATATALLASGDALKV